MEGGCYSATMTANEFFGNLTDAQKLELISTIVQSMSPEFRAEVLKELIRNGNVHEAELRVSSTEDLVRLDFGMPMAWFAIPKAHALRLGITLMEHAGAHVDQVQRPGNA